MAVGGCKATTAGWPSLGRRSPGSPRLKYAHKKSSVAEEVGINIGRSIPGSWLFKTDDKV